MDGLPKNKKPWGKAKEPKQIALDDYLFGRKLQEVYDKKQASNDMPMLFKKAAKGIKKAKSATLNAVKRKKTVVIDKPKKQATTLIDAPYIAPKKFKQAPNKPDIKVAKKTRLRSKKAKLTPKKSIVLAAATLLVAGSVLALMGKQSTAKKDTPKVEGATSPQKPDFETVLPKSNPEEKKVKFDPTKRVASFEDVIQGNRIVVSQQKLGETELKDTEFLKRTALNFNLKTELTTLKGTAYVGINISKNVQIVAFIYKDFLFFIQTDVTYKNQVLIDYIQALQ